jgi:hypothetical protein
VTAEDAPARVEIPRRVALADVTPVRIDAGSVDAGSAVDAATATAAGSAARNDAIVLEHAAGPDVRRILAVGGGHLYRLDGDHWQRLAFADAEARDVNFSHGAFYVLARGLGGNAGRALILRTARGDDLTVVSAPVLGPDSDPRVLVTMREGEYLVGGAHPALVMIGEAGTSVLARDLRPVISLRLMRDDTIIARHDREDVSLVRYGVVTPVTVGDYLDTAVDSNGTSYLVHEHGEFSRGRPGREYAVATTATPFLPRVVAAFAGERLLAVGERGPFADWEHHAWHVVQGDFPRDPIAILPTEPPAVVGRDGEVTVADPAGPRVIVRGQ